MFRYIPKDMHSIIIDYLTMLCHTCGNHCITILNDCKVIKYVDKITYSCNEYHYRIQTIDDIDILAFADELKINLLYNAVIDPLIYPTCIQYYNKIASFGSDRVFILVKLYSKNISIISSNPGWIFRKFIKIYEKKQSTIKINRCFLCNETNKLDTDSLTINCDFCGICIKLSYSRNRRNISKSLDKSYLVTILLASLYIIYKSTC